MMKKDALDIRSLKVEVVDDDQLVVRITVRNREARTVHAYSSVRRVQYDPATRTLRLCLHDGHVEEDSPVARHLKKPRFVDLKGNADSEITLSLPPVMRRLVPSAEAGGAARAEVLDLSQAEHVEVEVGFQDTPFYFNPAGPSMRAQLSTWQGAVARVRHDVSVRRVRGPAGGGRRPPRSKG